MNRLSIGLLISFAFLAANATAGICAKTHDPFASTQLDRLLQANQKAVALRHHLQIDTEFAELERDNNDSRQAMFRKEISAMDHAIDSYIFYKRSLAIAENLKQKGKGNDPLVARIENSIDPMLVEMVEAQLSEIFGESWPEIKIRLVSTVF